MWVWLIGLSVIVLLVAVWLIRGSRYYGRMFSAENFAQFHDLFSTALAAAQASDDAEAGPNVDDGTAFVTDAGLAVGVSFDEDDEGRYCIAISMSQPGRLTTRAVCSRFGFFVLAMLWELDKEVAPFCMPSRVHHMHILIATAQPRLLDFETSYAIYEREYQRVPFRHAS